MMQHKVKGQGKRKKSKSSRNAADEVGSTMDDKWVIKELHGTREAPQHCHSLPWPGEHSWPQQSLAQPCMAPGHALPGHPAQQQGHMQIWLQRQQRLVSTFSSGFYSAPRLGRGMCLLRAHGLSSPKKCISARRGPTPEPGLQL